MQKIIFVMGVSGSGKTTIGKMLARELNLPFFDADDFHPPANVNKMSRGEPLNDEDRAPWLDNLNELARAQAEEKGAVITCSALKAIYRRRLEKGIHDLPDWVFLDGDFDLLLSRMNDREDHFMPASLLQSQFDTLEVPKSAIKVDVAKSPEEIIAELLPQLT
ncbi:MAG: gluconokinase [Bacteroidota bacterium]